MEVSLKQPSITSQLSASAGAVICLLGSPLFLLWVSPQSIHSVLFVAVVQIVYALFLIVRHISEAKYRNNPFIVGAFMLFIYIGLSPLVIYNKVEVVSVNWQQFLTEEGIDNKSILKSQLLLNLFGVVLLWIGVYLTSFITQFQQ